MLTLPAFDRGLGQLEAYVGVDEGVAFQMDNNLYWDSLSTGSPRAIQGVEEKRLSSKFWVNQLPSGKVVLRNWIGMYLAPVERRTNPRTFPVQLVPYSESPNLRFEVFHRGNRVAFECYNGLFLGIVHRGTHTVEATMFFPEENCFFRPLIGDLEPPAFSLLRLIPRRLTNMNATSRLVQWQSYVNMTEETKQHTFTLTWETKSTDRMFWPHLWGLGIPSSFGFSIGEAKPTLVYNQDNEHRPRAQRDISEMLTMEVDVPRKCEALALLFADCYDPTFLPFTAVIRKVKPGGAVVNLREPGTWVGLFYDNLRIDIKYRNLH